MLTILPENVYYYFFSEDKDTFYLIDDQCLKWNFVNEQL